MSKLVSLSQICFFGWIGSFFLLMTLVANLLLLSIGYSKMRRVGLLAMLPPGLQKVMTEVSFFDILVNVLIYRRVSKMIIAIFSPFLKASTPEEAKEILKKEGKIPIAVYRGLLRKVSGTRG